jgi:hypothetical protein
MDRRYTRKRLDAATAASAAAGNMIAGADVSEARESTGGASSGVGWSNLLVSCCLPGQVDLRL